MNTQIQRQIFEQSEKKTNEIIENWKSVAI